MMCSERFFELVHPFLHSWSHEKIVAIFTLFTTVLFMNLQRFIDKYRSMIKLFVNVYVALEVCSFLSRVMFWF